MSVFMCLLRGSTAGPLFHDILIEVNKMVPMTHFSIDT